MKTYFNKTETVCWVRYLKKCNTAIFLSIAQLARSLCKFKTKQITFFLCLRCFVHKEIPSEILSTFRVLVHTNGLRSVEFKS
jgi:hypothetical protein